MAGPPSPRDAAQLEAGAAQQRPRGAIGTPDQAATSLPSRGRRKEGGAPVGGEMGEGRVELGVALRAERLGLGPGRVGAVEKARQEADEVAPRRPRSIAALAAVR
jgi:hypothetical protein